MSGRAIDKWNWTTAIAVGGANRPERSRPTADSENDNNNRVALGKPLPLE